MKRRLLTDDLPTFQKTTLANGVRVLTEHIPSVRSIAVGLWVHTGSRDEEPGEEGISHFIEHAVFKGTTRRRMHHIAQRMEAVGGYLNAFTGKEYTCYFARALDSHLDRAVDVVTDLILEPTFPEKELEKEKDVVIEELKMYADTPEDYVFDLFEEIVYAGHPMGQTIIGTEDSIKSFSRDGLLAYMNRRYTPDRTIMAASGNVDHDTFVRLVEKAYAAADRPPHPGESVVPELPPYEAKSALKTRPMQQAHLVIGTRAVSIYDDRRVALSVLNTIFGGGMSSRLNQNIREKYGFCYSVYSFLNVYADAGDMGVYMGTDPSKLERSKQLILREFRKLAEKPVSARMLSQAKSQMKGSLLMGLEGMSNRMMRLGRQELYFGRYASLDEIVAEVDAVTAEDVQRVAQKLFAEDAFTIAEVVPGESAEVTE